MLTVYLGIPHQIGPQFGGWVEAFCQCLSKNNFFAWSCPYIAGCVFKRETYLNVPKTKIPIYILLSYNPKTKSISLAFCMVSCIKYPP